MHTNSALMQSPCMGPFRTKNARQHAKRPYEISSQCSRDRRDCTDSCRLQMDWQVQLWALLIQTSMCSPVIWMVHNAQLGTDCPCPCTRLALVRMLTHSSAAVG